MRPFLRRVEPGPVRSARHRWLAQRNGRRHARAWARNVLAYDSAWDVPGDPEPSLEHVASQAATEAQMRSANYAAVRDALRLPADLHRKYWEFAYIVRALEAHGALHDGARGLGFAVGVEPLPAYFASRGCTVLATDLAPDVDASQGWIESGQHLTTKAALNERGICDADAFDDRVAVRWLDMNAIDPALRNFDFSWSACAFEHLGSLGAGLDFVRNQLACLRPGGVSVHTTEFNVSSDHDTLTTGPTVLFRRADIVALKAALERDGHTVAPLTFRLGDAAGDRDIIQSPYEQQSPHLKIQVGNYVTTSFGLIIVKGSS